MTETKSLKNTAPYWCAFLLPILIFCSIQGYGLFDQTYLINQIKSLKLVSGQQPLDAEQKSSYISSDTYQDSNSFGQNAVPEWDDVFKITKNHEDQGKGEIERNNIQHSESAQEAQNAESMKQDVEEAKTVNDLPGFHLVNKELTKGEADHVNKDLQKDETDQANKDLREDDTFKSTNNESSFVEGKKSAQMPDYQSEEHSTLPAAKSASLPSGEENIDNSSNVEEWDKTDHSKLGMERMEGYLENEYEVENPEEELLDEVDDDLYSFDTGNFSSKLHDSMVDVDLMMAKNDTVVGVPLFGTKRYPALNKKMMRFIVGISNGHQGTTFFGTKNEWADELTNPRKHVLFVFENRKSNIRRPYHRETPKLRYIRKASKPLSDKFTYSRLRQWYAFSPNNRVESDVEQRDIVMDNLVPNWNKRAEERGADTVFITGHDSIYYFRGFAEMLQQTTFVRIRRSRTETARSFCEAGLHNLHRMFSPVHKKNCVMNTRRGYRLHSYSYCPLEQPFSVVLKIDPEKWRMLSPYQRGLWYVDELEARWNRFIQEFPQAKYIEVGWSSKNPQKYGSIYEAQSAMGRLIHLDSSHGHQKAVKTHGSHSNTISPGGKTQESYEFIMKMIDNQTETLNSTMSHWIQTVYEKQETEYKQIANYSKEQLKLIEKVQF